MIEPLPPEGIPLADPPWEAWHPREAAERLTGVRARWCVAAGWALDLLGGGRRREHEDLEIAVPAADFGAIRGALAGYEFQVAGDGRVWPMDGPAFERMNQTWVFDPSRGVYRMDVLREPHEGDVWICRRSPRIRLPYQRVILRTDGGIPILAPEIVLLFKAKADRDKDRGDLEATLPLLGPSQRECLRGAVEMAHPGHPWLATYLAER